MICELREIVWKNLRICTFFWVKGPVLVLMGSLGSFTFSHS